MAEVESNITNFPINIGPISASQDNAEKSHIWAEGTDSQVEELGGEHSAKEWAEIAEKSVSGAKWGNITGTLSHQTDLKNALDDKANSSELATVATTGSYNDLTNKPTIPEGLPSQAGNNGKFLTTNGSTASWETVSSGANTSLSNLTDTGKIYSAHLATPSSTKESLTPQPSGSSYTAPADGYFVVICETTTGIDIVGGIGSTNGNIGGAGGHSFVFVSKGTQANIFYGTSNYLEINFIYANGSVSEYTPS